MTLKKNLNQARLDSALNLIYKNKKPLEGTKVYSENVIGELVFVITIEPTEDGVTKAEGHLIDCVTSDSHYIFYVKHNKIGIPKLHAIGAARRIEADWYHFLHKQVPYYDPHVDDYLQKLYETLCLIKFPGMDEAYTYVQKETRKILKSCLK